MVSRPHSTCAAAALLGRAPAVVVWRCREVYSSFLVEWLGALLHSYRGPLFWMVLRSSGASMMDRDHLADVAGWQDVAGAGYGGFPKIGDPNIAP